jgi:gliding motility-associated-like protein
VFENLLAGTYAVIATDANGCTASSTNILISQPPAITFTSVTVQDVACFGDATGTISVTAQGGVGGIQFSIQPSGNQASPGFFSGLYAGTYTVSAVDGNNCVVTSLVTVGSNPQLRLNSVTLTEPICFGDNNGAITATAVGGVAPIQFSLNNSPFQNNGTFNNLYAGYYIMTLRDAIGCLEDTLINLTQPTEVGAIVQTTAALCVDSEDGKVKITGTGGRGGYKYYLTPGLYINKSGVFSGLAIGTYTLRVVDTAGCEYRNVFNINPPANPLNNFMTKTDLGCFGRGNEGQATANVLGGTPPYNFLWNTSPAQTTATASTLYFGLYKVQITDANGCAIKDSVYISEGPCCDVAFIPNAFSPNGDGNNDEFRILTSAGVELQQLEIFNRWGQSVWKSNDVHRAWNGYIGGQEAPLDTYYYVLRYKCNRDNETYTKKGDVILVR